MNAVFQDQHAPRKRWMPARLFAACFLSVFTVFGQTGSDPSTEQRVAPSLTRAELQSKVAAASEPAATWEGPRTGPPAQPGKRIAVISEDLRNGGILGVAQGIHEAATEMRWTVKVFDAAGTPGGRDQASEEALASQPDGVILIGADAEDMQSRLNPFVVQHIPIVGWHVGSKIGVMANSPVAVNISTDPREVACITAAAAAIGAKSPGGGVVIFTDPSFKIAQAKSSAMADIIRASKDCSLLEVREVAISRSAEQMPGIVRELLKHYGDRWTCALAINDIYFDYAIPELTKAGKSPGSIRLLSAGDGSAAAFMRIQAGIYQVATVAEPLNLHGWQLVDELNRLMAHQPLSGYVAPVHLVTAENVAFDAGLRLHYDPDNGYRAIYRHIWKR